MLLKKSEPYHTGVCLVAFEAVVRQSSGSCQAVVRQSPGNRQTVVKNLFGHGELKNKEKIVCTNRSVGPNKRGGIDKTRVK